MKKNHPRFFSAVAVPFVLMVTALLLTSTKTFAQPQITFSPFLKNMRKPINVTNAGDSSGRIFIVEQFGKIRIYKNGALLQKPFLDISNIIDTTQYRGIWSVAFHPDYKNNGVFFVYYIDSAGLTTLARFKTSKNNPDSAVANSRVVLFALPTTGTNDPHLGEMHFGRDGYLYISINDGSIYEYTSSFAQDGQQFYGKMLRLDVNTNKPPYYKVPRDNPFVNDTNYKPEIWALGLRNAWRWSFDRQNNNMWLADVGAAAWEEVDLRTPHQSFGANFGWPCYEANTPFDTTGCKGSSNYIFPIFAYPHVNSTSAEVIIGGYVYRGISYPTLRGYYVCIDYTTGNIWKLKPNGNGGYTSYLQTGGPINVESFGEDENGELYATAENGSVYKITVSSSLSDSETMEPSSLLDENGNPVQ